MLVVFLVLTLCCGIRIVTKRKKDESMESKLLRGYFSEYKKKFWEKP